MQLKGKAAVACSAVVLVGAGCCVGFLFLHDSTQPVVADAKKEAAAPPPASTGSAPASPTVAPVAEPAAVIPEPALACGAEPWEARPGDPCALAMDHRFHGEEVPPVPLFSGHGGWFPDEEDEALLASRARRDPAMPMWRDVFAIAEADRALAEAALADPACAEGMSARRTACAADAVAALGLVQEACVQQLAEDGVRNPWAGPRGNDGPMRLFEPAEKTEIWRRRVDRLDADPDLTPEEYWRKRRRAETAMYRYAWRMMRCAALPESTLAWFPEFSTPTGDLGDDKQSKALYGFAARHGVEWAEARLQILPTITSGPYQVFEDEAAYQQGRGRTRTPDAPDSGP